MISPGLAVVFSSLVAAHRHQLCGDCGLRTVLLEGAQTPLIDDRLNTNGAAADEEGKWNQVGDKRKHQTKGAPKKETYPMIPQHAKAWCEQGESCNYKWSCKFKHCVKDGVTWHNMGFTKTPQQIQAYEEAERRGATEAPYYKPAGSPKRQPVAKPQP